MFRRLDLKPFKDARQMLGRVIAIVVVLGVALSLVAGGLYSEDILENTRESVFRESDFADAEVIVDAADDSHLQKLIDLEGIERAEGRAVLNGLAFLFGELRPAIIVGIPADGISMNTYSLSQGSVDLEEGSALVVRESKLLGERIDLLVSGVERSYDIKGVVDSVEFAATPAVPGSPLPFPGNSLVLYVPLDSLDGFPYNSILLGYTSGIHDGIESEIMISLEGSGFQRIVHVEDQFVHALFEASIHEMRSVMPIMSAIFALIGALLIVVVVSKVILSQQREIGVLMAIGYSSREIVRSYLLFALIIGLVAGLFGGVLGVLFGLGIVQAFMDMLIGLPPEVVITPFPFLLSLALGIALVIVAVLISVIRVASLTPREAMREQDSKDSIARIGGRLGSVSKISLRNVFRRPRRLIALLIALVLTIGLSGSWLVMTESMMGMMSGWEDQQDWDIQVTLSRPYDMVEIDASLSTIELDIIGYENFYLAFGKAGGKDVRLLGIEPGSEMNRFLVSAGDPDVSGDRCLLPAKIANEIGVNVGDLVEVGVGTVGKQLIVGAVIQDLRENTVFLSIMQVQQLTGNEDGSTGVFMRVAGDLEGAKGALYSLDGASHVMTAGDFEGGMSEMIEEGMAFLYVFFLASLSVLIVTVVTVSLINVMERKPEYGILGILGYRRWTSYRIIMQEIMTLGGISTLIGLPVTYLFSLILRDIYSDMVVHFPIVITLTNILIIASSSLTFFLISSLSPIGAIRRSSLVELVRSRMIE